MKLKYTSILLLLVVLMFGMQGVGAQISPDQQKLINSGIYYYDVDEFSTRTVCDPTSTFSSGQNIYMIGDSITRGSAGEIESVFAAEGATITIDAVDSRSLSVGVEPTDGLSVLENSQEIINNSDVAIVALGTNGGLTEANIVEALNLIRVNSTIEVFWVNISANNDLRSGSPLNYNGWNTALEAAADTFDFRIIDWNSVVSSNEDIIIDDGLGVHPNESGQALFAQTIIDGVTGEATGNGCGSIVLEGNSNAEKVWNFMIAKGLQPYQVAGFMGNMQAEAGFEPRRVEYASSSDPWSEADFPDYLSDTVPRCFTNNCRPGYGIVQWTAESRKTGLTEYSEEAGVSVAELSTQLEYVWVEISNGGTFRGTTSVRNEYINTYGGNVPVLDALKQTTTIEEATSLILNHYEIPANISAAYEKRIVFARDWLNTFGGGPVGAL